MYVGTLWVRRMGMDPWRQLLSVCRSVLLPWSGNGMERKDKDLMDLINNFFLPLSFFISAPFSEPARLLLLLLHLIRVILTLVSF